MAGTGLGDSIYNAPTRKPLKSRSLAGQCLPKAFPVASESLIGESCEIKHLEGIWKF
jgi:hypothetical protein